jgi:hypothetical protein
VAGVGDTAIGGDGATNEAGAGGDSLQLPRQAPKKRRSELDNLKENLTDLMKAPVLPMSGSDDSEDVDKLREEEREKRKRKKDKGKSKEKHHHHKAKSKHDSSNKETPNAKLKDGKPPSGAVQLPTPSTTHSYASTNDGTPHQDDGVDDEHHTEIRAPTGGEASMITPPPSNRTHSLDEDEDSDPTKRATRSSRSLRAGKEKSNLKTSSEPDDASESNAGGSDEDEDESSTSEEERRRTYALRHRKPVNKDQGGAPANARNGVRRIGTNGVGGPTTAHGHGEGKKGKVCITCKWNELKTKNEITCGR